MANEDREIKVKLTFDDKFSKEFKRAGNDVSKQTKKLKGRFDGLKTSVGGLVAGFLGFQAIRQTVGFMVKAASAASDLEEATSKLSVVFKGLETQAASMSMELVDGYAMSRREAAQYLGSMQDLLVPMGLQKQAAADMSGAVVRLAADMGSFNNLPTATVMSAIRSALVGNFETMKDYGVTLNETVVKQRAMNDGLFDGKGRLDAATKAQVAFKIITEESSFAVGDMKRTQDQWANTVKKLGARWEDFLASMGTFIVKNPMWIGALNLLADGFEKMGDIINKVTKQKTLEERFQSMSETALNLKVKIDGVKESYKNQFNSRPDIKTKVIEKATKDLNLQYATAKELLGELREEIAKKNGTDKETIRLAKEKKAAEAAELAEKVKQAAFELDFNKAWAETNGQTLQEADEARVKSRRWVNRNLRLLREQDVENTKEATELQIRQIASLNRARENEAHNFVNNTFTMADSMKEFGALYKAAAVTITTVDTIKSAQAAFAALAGIPIVGPFLGGVAAAAATVAGMARVAQISQQKFALGGDFVTSGPQSIVVGDNPGGRERVQVTPLSSPNINGPAGGTNITLSDTIVINGNADESAIAAIGATREQQLEDMRQMLTEINAAGQMPIAA